MPHSQTSLLTPTEQRDLYGIPVLNEVERQAYFTFDALEMEAINQFIDVKDAVYFAMTLVFFKLKRTFISFGYQEVTLERQHVMKRYFPALAFPKSMPTPSTKKRIHLKVMEICQAKRLIGSVLNTVNRDLTESALYSPRQRQLLRELLRILSKHNVVVPKHTTLQSLVSQVWNQEQKRVLSLYLRHTTKEQRKTTLTLLDETEEEAIIVTMKEDLRSFKTHDLWEEIKKHAHLKSIFNMAKDVLEKLNLPLTTCQYYASLVHYYDRSRMKRIQPQKVGLYLLCYTFIRYPIVNDILIDAFKKRILENQNKATEYIDGQRLKHLEKIQEKHQQISAMMLMIDQSSASSIPKKKMYQYVPQEEWQEAALCLVDEKFDKQRLFWKYIDSLEDSIKLGIRALFLALDFTIRQNDSLKTVIAYMKAHLEAKTWITSPFPPEVIDWIEKKEASYVVKDKQIIHNRFEFLAYMKMVHALSANKITLQHTVKYKNVEEELIDSKTWEKTKKPLLKKLAYPKLGQPMKKTLKSKRKVLTSLYKTVNAAIERGKNKSVIITKNKQGERIWRLKPIEAELEENDSLFTQFKQQSIVEIIKFVNEQTNFLKAFESILPKGTQIPPILEYIGAAAYANAARMGVNKMASSSDLNESKLITTEANYIRVETVQAAIDMINNATAKFPIFDKWYLQSIVHGTFDALKLELKFAHHKGGLSRNSQKVT